MERIWNKDNLIYLRGVTFHWPQSPSQAFSCFTSHHSHMAHPADASAPPTALWNLILLMIQALSSTFARCDSRWSSSIRWVHKWSGERLNFAPCSSSRSFFHKSLFLCNYSPVLYFWQSPLSNKPTRTFFKKTTLKHTHARLSTWGVVLFFFQRKYKYLTGPVWKSCLWSASGFSRHVHMTFVWHLLLCSKYVVTCCSRKLPEWLHSAVPNYQDTFIAKKKWMDCNPNIQGEKKINNLIMLTKQVSHKECVHENYFVHHHLF